MKRILLLLLTFFCAVFFHSQTPEELHSLIKGHNYAALLDGLTKGADPVSLVYEGGGRRLLKPNSSASYDLMSRLLLQPCTPERDLVIEKLIEKKVVLSGFITNNYSRQFATDAANKQNTKLADYLAQKDPDAAGGMTTALKNRFDYFFKAIGNKYGYVKYKDELAAAAYESDTTEYLNELIEKFGVFPKQKEGIHPARITQATFRKKPPYEVGADSVIALLVKAGGTFEEPLNYREKYIHFLCRCKDSVLLKAIGKYIPSVFKQKDENGYTLLHLMAIYKSTEYLPYVMPFFKSADAKDLAGKKALDYIDKEDLVGRSYFNADFSASEKNALSVYKLCNKISLAAAEINEMNRLLGECKNEAWFTSSAKEKINASSLYSIAKENGNAEAMALLSKEETVWQAMDKLFEQWIKDDKYALIERSLYLNARLMKKVTDLLDDGNSSNFKYDDRARFISLLVKYASEKEVQEFTKQQLGAYSNYKSVDGGYRFLIEQNGKKGIVTLGGKVIVEPEYTELDTTGKLYLFKAITGADNLYNVMDRSFMPVEKISAKENLRSPEIVVWKKNYFLVFDSDEGKVIYDNTYGKYERLNITGVQEFKRLNNNYIIIKKKDKWGIWYYMSPLHKVNYKFKNIKATEENPDKEIEYEIGKEKRKMMMEDILNLLLK